MGDDRFGFSTHFDQGNPLSAIPVIIGTGCSYIRDDFNWTLVETTKGVYDPAGLKPFWAAAQSAGLKCVAICGSYSGNPIYTDPFDVTGLSNFCAWVAQQFPGIVIEVTNEPNNVYAGTEGSGWQTKLVTLTNACYDKVHAAVGSASPVIGYGAQGDDIINMLGMGGRIDGVVYHPYDANNSIPETCFEPQPTFQTYANWVGRVRAATNKPIWETERNGSWGFDYVCSVWNARRWILSMQLGVEHSFFYDFMDGNASQSLMDGNLNPRQAYYVLQRVMKYLAPLSVVAPPTITPGASDFDLADLYAYGFAGTNSTVATVWLGNYDPQIYNHPSSPPQTGTATITFPVSNAITAYAKIVDLVRGYELPLTSYRTTVSGGNLSVYAVPVTDCPLLIIAQ